MRTGTLLEYSMASSWPPSPAAAFADAFLFQMDLLPLSKEQQRLVLQQQMDHESVFFSNLLSFTEARSTMDKLFLKKCPERRIEEEKHNAN